MSSPTRRRAERSRFSGGAKHLARGHRGIRAIRARSLTRLNCAKFRD